MISGPVFTVGLALILLFTVALACAVAAHVIVEVRTIRTQRRLVEWFNNATVEQLRDLGNVMRGDQ